MRRPQQGYVLFAVLTVILALASVWLVSHLPTLGNSDLRDTATTHQALEQAKDALLAFAMAEDNSPGALPCPVDQSGNLSSDCSSSNKALPNATLKIAGRLPWKSLGIAAPQNATGDCLWLLLYAPMRNTVTTPNRPDFPINPDTLTDAGSTQGLSYAGRAYPAVLISPLAAGQNQRRTRSAGDVCAGGTPADFLDPVTADKTSREVAQSEGVRPISMNELLRPALRRVLEPLSQTCARTLIAAYPASATLAEIRKADLDKSDLVDAIDLAIGGCDQLDTCQQKLMSYGLALDHYGSTAEHALTSEERSEILGWCSLYRDKNDAVLAAGACPIQTHSPDKGTATPPFWLCHNGWYDRVRYDHGTQTLSVSLKGSTPYTCTAQLSSGAIRCQ